MMLESHLDACSEYQLVMINCRLWHQRILMPWNPSHVAEHGFVCWQLHVDCVLPVCVCVVLLSVR